MLIFYNRPNQSLDSSALVQDLSLWIIGNRDPMAPHACKQHEEESTCAIPVSPITAGSTKLQDWLIKGPTRPSKVTRGDHKKGNG